MKKILFFLGLGASYGECYVALQAAKHLRESYLIEFCLLTFEEKLISQIQAASFNITTFEIPNLHQNYFSDFIEVPSNFSSKLNEKLESYDLIFLIDYQHFFTKSELLQNYQTILKIIQTSLKNLRRPLVTFDHSLWTLNPHPYPEIALRVEDVPKNIKRIFMPSPPHHHNYSGMGEKHTRVSFFEKPKLSKKINSDRHKILISFSHFAAPIAEKISAISAQELLEVCLESLKELGKPCDLYITGISEENIKNVKMPSSIKMNSPQMNNSLFQDYDQSLAEMNLVILFNGISSTITRCFLQNTPVLLCYSKDFDIYPVSFPPLELIYNANPFFKHVRRVDIADSQKLSKEVKNLLECLTLKPQTNSDKILISSLKEIIPNMF